MTKVWWIPLLCNGCKIWQLPNFNGFVRMVTDHVLFLVKIFVIDVGCQIVHSHAEEFDKNRCQKVLASHQTSLHLMTCLHFGKKNLATLGNRGLHHSCQNSWLILHFILHFSFRAGNCEDACQLYHGGSFQLSENNQWGEHCAEIPTDHQ